MGGARELLKERRKDLTKALTRQRKQLTTRQERPAEVATALHGRTSAQAQAAILRQYFAWSRRS